MAGDLFLCKKKKLYKLQVFKCIDHNKYCHLNYNYKTNTMKYTQSKFQSHFQNFILTNLSFFFY